MTFFDFFNPHLRDHRNAYRELQKDGAWPKWFWAAAKAAVDPSTSALDWSQQAQYKMADAWLAIHEEDDGDQLDLD